MFEKWFLRPVLTFLLKLCFGVEVAGVENYYAAGDKVIVIANHQSYLDPLILGVFLPEKPAFAINIFQAEKWYFRWLDKLTTLYRLDPLKPISMKRLIQDLRHGAKVVIFPEGRITTTGGIMKIYDGTGMIAEKTGATILPVRIDGAEFSKVSRLGGKLKRRWFPTVRLTFLPPGALRGRTADFRPRHLRCDDRKRLREFQYPTPAACRCARRCRAAWRRACRRQRYHARSHGLSPVVHTRLCAQ